MEEGYIKISRKMLAWEWFTDEKTVVVFLYCLLKANWKDGRFRGQEIPRGSFVTGRKKIAEALNISEQSVRTALAHLQSTNEITITRTPKGSIITVVKYDEYQTANQQNTEKSTKNQPTTNQQLTTIEEYKEYKNKKNIYSTRRKNPNEDLQNIEELYLDEVRRDSE